MLPKKLEPSPEKRDTSAVAPPPQCWHCAEGRVVDVRGALMIAGWPLRRDGSLRAPARVGSLLVFWLCSDCLLGERVKQDRAYLVPLALVYNEQEYATVRASIAAQPWGADPKIAPALALAHTIALASPDEVVNGGEREMQYDE